MIKRTFFLLTFICLASPVQAIVGDISHNMFTSNNTYTHTPIELKPASFLELDIPSLKGAYKTASVCFLGQVGCGSDAGFEKNNDGKLDVDSANKCKQEGYQTASELKCTNLEVLDNLCPYNSSYGRSCVCMDNLFSCSFPQQGVGSSCGGKYMICNCPGYSLGSASCKSPKELSEKCDVMVNMNGTVYTTPQYKKCTCPIGVNSSYGCKEYYPSPCDSVCKVANVDACSAYDDIETPFGCKTWWADCPSKCQTAYTDNCHNREDAIGTYGCESYWSDCPSKCQKVYADNCRNRTEAIAQYGCETYWSDCSKKCQTPYLNNCLNRDDETAPYGCQTYWADCSEKCQTPFPDNCHTRVDRAVPVNASCSMSYSDCASKCANWRCNSGFTYWCSKPEKDCTTLGYTQSASQCTGDYLVCPYGTNVYCVEQ